MFEYWMFHRLPVWSQVQVLEREGTFLAKRKLLDYTVSLYSLDHYFVEVWSGAGFKISTSFRKTTRPISILEPYLEDLSLPELFDQN